MRDDLTDVTIVLDRSGSMMSVVSDTVGGFKTFVDEQKKASGEVRISLVQFDDVYERVFENKLLSDVPTLDFKPRNWTALYDAIGKTINDVGARLATMQEDDRPGKVLIIIITDGQENASKDFNGARIAEMIKHQRERYKWEFVFIGANQDAALSAKALNIGNFSNYSHTSVGTEKLFRSLGASVSCYASNAGATMDCMGLNNEQEKLLRDDFMKKLNW
jgi:hypothetical protein